MNQRLLRYLERSFHFKLFGRGKASQQDYICLDCRTYSQRQQCCGHYTYVTNGVVRIPKRTASDAAWRQVEAELMKWDYNRSLQARNQEHQHRRGMHE